MGGRDGWPGGPAIVTAPVYQAGPVWLCIANRPSLSAVGGVVMAFAQQRISAKRIARPGVAALTALAVRH